MLFNFAKRDKGYELAAQAKARMRNAKSKLVTTLNQQIKLLETLIESNSDSESKYSETELAKVLVAAANYLQYLKLCGSKVGKNERVILEYLSQTNNQKSNFPTVCTALVQDLQSLSATSPMIMVRHNDLLNTYIYLLYRIQPCKG